MISRLYTRGTDPKSYLGIGHAPAGIGVQGIWLKVILLFAKVYRVIVVYTLAAAFSSVPDVFVFVFKFM
jgi:hypothetical protein